MTTKVAVEVLQPQAQECLGRQNLQEVRKDPSLEASEGTRPCQHLGFRHSISRTVRDGISAAWSLPHCCALLRQLWETHGSADLLAEPRKIQKHPSFLHKHSSPSALGTLQARPGWEISFPETDVQS